MSEYKTVYNNDQYSYYNYTSYPVSLNRGRLILPPLSLGERQVGDNWNPVVWAFSLSCLTGVDVAKDEDTYTHMYSKTQSITQD